LPPPPATAHANWMAICFSKMILLLEVHLFFPPCIL
jgi:hypothetical protein